MIDNGYLGDRLDEIRSLPGVDVRNDGTNRGFAGWVQPRRRRSDVRLHRAGQQRRGDRTRHALAARRGRRSTRGRHRRGQHPPLRPARRVEQRRQRAALPRPQLVRCVRQAGLHLPGRAPRSRRRWPRRWCCGAACGRSSTGSTSTTSRTTRTSRCRCAAGCGGCRCATSPTPVVRHAYDFDRHDTKLYLVERNRVAFWLIAFERRTQLVLGCAAFVVSEVGTLALAMLQGWGRQKLRSYRWLVANRDWLARPASTDPGRTHPSPTASWCPGCRRACGSSPSPSRGRRESPTSGCGPTGPSPGASCDRGWRR